MRGSVVLFLFFIGLVFSACEKVEYEKENKKGNFYGVCGVGCGVDFCTDSSYENPDQVASDVEVYILEPLVVSDECGCIVKGMVKYLKNGETAAMVSYGNGECDDIAEKILCVNGDCDDKNAVKCMFTLKCDVSD
ncbi:hypothetical protein KFE94_06400 [bacterium SCSIO 12643]|nr:hypothetical protein KFE94_06400 [bacterium SCSIO 12643]